MAFSWTFLTLGIIVALIALGTVAINNALEQSTLSDVRIVRVQEPLTGPPSSQVADYGATVEDINDVQRIAGYTVGYPSYLPFGNSLKMVKVNEDAKYVILIFSQADVTDSMFMDDILRHKGFLVIYSVKLPSFDAEEFIQSNVDEAPDVRRAVEINGMLGLANHYSVVIDPNDVELHIPAQVTFFKGEFQINLVAQFHMNELIKIARSIPLEPVGN